MSSDKTENVLILQGGGSLGAFGCGVFKALANNNIKIDIEAGTSTTYCTDNSRLLLGKYAYMKVYGPNKTLLKISSSPHVGELLLQVKLNLQPRYQRGR